MNLDSEAVLGWLTELNATLSKEREEIAKSVGYRVLNSEGELTATDLNHYRGKAKTNQVKVDMVQAFASHIHNDESWRAK